MPKIQCKSGVKINLRKLWQRLVTGKNLRFKAEQSRYTRTSCSSVRTLFLFRPITSFFSFSRDPSILSSFSRPSHEPFFFVGFDILTAVVMKISILWNIMLCSSLTVNGRSGGTCRPFIFISSFVFFVLFLSLLYFSFWFSSKQMKVTLWVPGRQHRILKAYCAADVLNLDIRWRWVGKFRLSRCLFKSPLGFEKVPQCIRRCMCGYFLLISTTWEFPNIITGFWSV
jgi:hypothetical protein